MVSTQQKSGIIFIFVKSFEHTLTIDPIILLLLLKHKENNKKLR